MNRAPKAPRTQAGSKQRNSVESACRLFLTRVSSCVGWYLSSSVGVEKVQRGRLRDMFATFTSVAYNHPCPYAGTPYQTNSREFLSSAVFGLPSTGTIVSLLLIANSSVGSGTTLRLPGRQTAMFLDTIPYVQGAPGHQSPKTHLKTGSRWG